MSTEIKVPTLPESVADATIVTWHKQAGETVQRDEVLVDIETDKVVLEVPAPAAGVVAEIIETEGATVVANQLIGRVAEATGAAPPADPPATSAAQTPNPSAPPAMGPAARRLVAQNQLDPTTISGSGRAGRITKEDVETHLATQPGDTVMTPNSTPAAANDNTVAATPAALDESGRHQKRVPMTRLRARIAERLLHAKQSTAMLTTFNEVNMQPLMELRKQYRDQFEKTHGIKLGFMSMFVRAAAEALKRYPAINASIDGTDLVYHGYCDIGVAVSSDRGLVVPILRNAEHMSLAAIEAGIADFGQRAREGKLGIDEMTGGTFTLSNGGVFGSLLSTPILNPPQSAILGMHATQERPVAENGAVVIRPMMYVALSYDHRIVDGKEAVTFLKTIKELVEDPARILLEL